MNIEEEIKNITEYLNKIENGIIIENNKLLTQKEINNERDEITGLINKVDSNLIKINNDINIFTGNKKRDIDKERIIYNNELQRLIDKKELIKEEGIILLKQHIQNSVNLYINKKILLTEIKLTSDKIAEFNSRKHILRSEFIKNVKINNSVIKESKARLSEKNSIKETLKEIENEINSYSTKKNIILNNTNQDVTKQNDTNQNEIVNKLLNLDMEHQKLIKKRNKLQKYLLNNLVNTSQPLLKNKLPANYKEYKTILERKKQDLIYINNTIKQYNNELNELEYKLTDNYIDNLLSNEKLRCETRWSKINERVNEDINNYKNNYKNEIDLLQQQKTQLMQKLSLLHNINISKSEEEKIINNNTLLTNIKNRLSYLKQKKI